MADQQPSHLVINGRFRDYFRLHLSLNQEVQVLKTKRTVSLLTGMVLGDGCLKLGSTGVQLAIKHGASQKAYLEHKAVLLGEVFGRVPKVRSINNNGYPGFELAIQDPYLKSLRSFIYENGSKFFSKKVLSRLDPEGLALWHMDDGNLTLHKRKESIHSREIYLNTYCSFVEAETIKEFLKERFGLDFRIAKHKEAFRLACNTSNAKQFVEIVKPFVIPSMNYKIDLKYNQPM